MKRTFNSFLILIIMVLCLSLAACGSSSNQTLEEYMNEHSSEMASIESTASSTDGLTITIEDNEVIYTFDIKALEIDGMTNNIALSDDSKKAYDDIITESADTYTEFCSTLEDAYDISGIACTVTYTYGDSVITSKTFVREQKK